MLNNENSLKQKSHVLSDVQEFKIKWKFFIRYKTKQMLK